MATVTRTEYGTYEHGTPELSRDYGGHGTWRRSDKWTSKGGDVTWDRLFAAGPGDDSPIYSGRYHSACSCCYLGFGHTTEAHVERV